ncbi:hypothetical protein ACER0C_024904 [Sarotherodon galilaeus]
MATMVTTHLEELAPSHILMCHKQDFNITNHSHVITNYCLKAKKDAQWIYFTKWTIPALP